MNITPLQKLRSTDPSLGTWLSSGSATVSELAARCGLDWLLLDMEHGCLSEAELLSNLRAINGHPVATVVRVPTHEAGLIARVLDWGADAIMVPHVESATEAEALVRAMRYSPEGDRGFSRSVRAYGYGLESPEGQPKPMLFAQIESVRGVENVEAIAGVEGVDVLFVGPADLRLSLSTHPGAPSYEEALDLIIESAKTNATLTGILVRDRKDTEPLIKQGFTKIAVDSDMSILRSGFLSIRGER